MAEFLIRERARRDLIHLAHYTQMHWGIEQRNRYLIQLNDCFHMLAAQPEPGTACDEIRTGYRKYPQGKHLAFYRTAAQGIEIIRVLHQSMDPDQQF